jgi:hypothetical protein
MAPNTQPTTEPYTIIANPTGTNGTRTQQNLLSRSCSYLLIAPKGKEVSKIWLHVCPTLTQHYDNWHIDMNYNHILLLVHTVNMYTHYMDIYLIRY